MRVAVLPIGYADGLRRELSNPNPHTGEPTGGWAIIHTPDGQLCRAVRALIVGRISMNLTIIDVTHIDGLTPGHEVTLLGDGITAEDHARIARTIPYEILCGIKLLLKLPAQQCFDLAALRHRRRSRWPASTEDRRHRAS